VTIGFMLAGCPERGDRSKGMFVSIQAGAIPADFPGVVSLPVKGKWNA
jgi:hypothetical protein